MKRFLEPLKFALKAHSCRVTLRLVLTFLLAVTGIGALPSASMAGGSPTIFNNAQLRGTWVWSGLIHFAAPIPLPAEIVDGGPPHDVVSPGDVIGTWASILGTITFDGSGAVTRVQDLVKPGEIRPLLPPPFDYVPPFPEVGSGSYSVSDGGAVDIALESRNADSPEGQVDFEFDLNCVIVKRHEEMQCITARFKTFAVDPNGFPSPITGVITMNRQK